MQLHRSISFKLAAIGVLLVFMLSFCFGIAQIYSDYSREKAAHHLEVTNILDAAKPAAQHAIHTLDAKLAIEVLRGLLVHDYIVNAALVADTGAVLARLPKPLKPSQSFLLGKLISKRIKEVQVILSVNENRAAKHGHLLIHIDLDAVYQPFYQRCLNGLLFTLLQIIIMVLLLFLLFYIFLAKPLRKLALQVGKLNLEDPELGSIHKSRFNRYDEIGFLVDSFNMHMSKVAELLAEQKQQEALLLQKELHKQKIIDTVPHMIYAKNEAGEFVFANYATAKAFGKKPGQLEAMSLADLAQLVPAYQVSKYRASDNLVITREVSQFVKEEDFINHDGELRILHTQRVPLESEQGLICLGVSVDITAQKRAEAALLHNTYHDPLTNLFNRTQLIEYLEKEVKRSGRHKYCGAVLFIDLDHFKHINDSLGHPVGDLVLQEIATRLSNSCREEDFVARLGGDDFVVVAPELSKNPEDAAQLAMLIAKKLRQIIDKPIVSSGQSLRVSASIGIVLFPAKDTGVHEILRYADTAMYHAKEEGRDTIEFFSDYMVELVDRHLVLENELRHAVEEEQFVLHFQPLWEAVSQRIIGAEVLLRWQHPEMGLVSPGEFIPILESSRLIIPAGRWLLKTVFEIVKQWHDQNLWEPRNRISINISPRQFRDDDFVHDVESLMNQVAIDPNWIEFEITEGIVIHNVEATIKVMNRLSDIGVSFSLDDFGTGYSSLSYLKKLPVNTLKIDQTFVRDLCEDPNDAAIVAATLAMAKGLNLDVIAEGVETKQQLHFLIEHGCKNCQGYFFSKPLPIAEFEQFVIQRSH